MSVSSTTNRKQVTLTAAAQAIATGIYILDADHLIVKRTRSGTDTTLVKDTDYTVSGVLNGAGSTVTTIAQTIGDIITVTRVIPKTQTTDYIANSKFSSANTETNLDKLTLIAQDQDEILQRTIRLPETATDAQIAGAEIDATATDGYALTMGAGGTGIPGWAAVPTFGGAEKVYSTKAAMKAATGLTVGTRAVVLGEAEPFELTTETAGAVTTTTGIEIASDISGVYWKRQFSGPADPRWWGVVGDSTDAAVVIANSDAANAAIIACAGKHKLSFSGDTTYHFGQPSSSDTYDPEERACLRVRSNTHIEVQTGTTLKMADDVNRHFFYTSGNGAAPATPTQIENVTFSGGGTIDCNGVNQTGDAGADLAALRLGKVSAIWLRWFKNVRVQNLRLVNTTSLAVLIAASEDVFVADNYIESADSSLATGYWGENMDGIHLFNVNRFTVTGNQVITADDQIAITSNETYRAYTDFASSGIGVIDGNVCRGKTILTGPGGISQDNGGGNIRVTFESIETLEGTAVSGTATTIVLDGSASTTDDAYNLHTIEIRTGTGASSTLVTITDYDGASKTATVASWPSGTPDATSTYRVVDPSGELSDIVVSNNECHDGLRRGIIVGAFATDLSNVEKAEVDQRYTKRIKVIGNQIYQSNKRAAIAYQRGDSAIHVEMAEDIEVIDNTIRDVEGPGVYLRSVDEVLIKGNHINGVDDIATGPTGNFPFYGSGIYAESARGRITNVTIDGNFIKDVEHAGIYISDYNNAISTVDPAALVSGIIVRNNHIENFNTSDSTANAAAVSGVSIYGAVAPLVQENRIVTGSASGIHLRRCSNPDVRGNFIKDTDYSSGTHYGIWILPLNFRGETNVIGATVADAPLGDAWVIGNEVRNSGRGISVTNYQNVYLDKNRVRMDDDTARAMRVLHDGVVDSGTAAATVVGTAAAGAASTITLAAGSASLDDAYNGFQIEITSGTGSGQTKTISDYDGTTLVATVSVAWSTNPDATSVYAITPTTGGIILGSSASITNGEYNNYEVVTTGGTGSGQTKDVTGYDGATKVALISGTFSPAPDATTTYEVRAKATWSGTVFADNNFIEFDSGISASDAITGLYLSRTGFASGVMTPKWGKDNVLTGTFDVPVHNANDVLNEELRDATWLDARKYGYYERMPRLITFDTTFSSASGATPPSGWSNVANGGSNTYAAGYTLGVLRVQATIANADAGMEQTSKLTIGTRYRMKAYMRVNPGNVWFQNSAVATGTYQLLRIGPTGSSTVEDASDWRWVELEFIAKTTDFSFATDGGGATFYLGFFSIEEVL